MKKKWLLISVVILIVTLVFSLLFIKNKDDKVKNQEKLEITNTVKKSKDETQSSSNGGTWEELVEDEEYFTKKISENTTLSDVDDSYKLNEAQSKEIKNKIKEIISSYPQIPINDPGNSKAEEVLELTEKYFGKKSSQISQLSIILTGTEVEPNKIELKKSSKNLVAFEFNLTTKKNKKDYAYVTGYYNLKTQLFNVTYTTLLRDGMIFVNEAFDETHRE